MKTLNLNNQTIKPSEFRSFVESVGWELVQEAIKDDLFVFNNKKEKDKQLVILMKNSDPSYNTMLLLALEKLSILLGKSIQEMMSSIRQFNEDVLYVRCYSDNNNLDYLSLDTATKKINAIKNLFLTAAHSVVNPLIFHSQLSLKEPRNILSNSRFLHTMPGSFTFRVSHPFEVPTTVEQLSLFESSPEKPKSRAVYETIINNSQVIHNAIDNNRIDKLYDSQKRVDNPHISYNFCEALSSLYDHDHKDAFELNVKWSQASLKYIVSPKIATRIEFPEYLKPQVTTVANTFKPIHFEDYTDDFVGTVEKLTGQINKETDQRSGTVTLSILDKNGHALSVKTDLDENKYHLATEAHGKGRSYIRIKGHLIKKARSYILKEVTHFSYFENIT